MKLFSGIWNMNECDGARLGSDEGEWFAYAHGMNKSEQENAFFELVPPKPNIKDGMFQYVKSLSHTRKYSKSSSILDPTRLSRPWRMRPMPRRTQQRIWRR